MNARLLTYEQVVLPHHSKWAPVLITVSVASEARCQVTEESHIFIPTVGKYLQETSYRSLKNADFDTLAALGIQTTRRLLTSYLSMHSVVPGLSVLRSSPLVIRPLATHPFHRFRIENRFVQEMWEIQEWTCSVALRECLAEVMSYRSDPGEAALLTQVFTDGELESCFLDSVTPADGHCASRPRFGVL